jgi:molybdenum-dependent DNA-binding transcriptional regulator ModE
MNGKQSRRIRKAAKMAGVPYKKAKKAFKAMNSVERGKYTALGKHMGWWR